LCMCLGIKRCLPSPPSSLHRCSLCGKRQVRHSHQLLHLFPLLSSFLCLPQSLSACTGRTLIFCHTATTSKVGGGWYYSSTVINVTSKPIRPSSRDPLLSPPPPPPPSLHGAEAVHDRVALGSGPGGQGWHSLDILQVGITPLPPLYR